MNSAEELVVGNLDLVNHEQISGWAWDPADPARSVKVDIYSGDRLLCTVAANRFRQDLLDAGVGTGEHGFALATPDGIKDGQAHTIRARMVGTSMELPGSPQTRILTNPLKANVILGALYAQPDYLAAQAGYSPEANDWRSWSRRCSWSRRNTRARASEDPLPLPPAELRMGYTADDKAYLAAGEHTVNEIREILRREGVALGEGDAVLDWGCASGRVVRHFADQALRGEVWGADQHSPSIQWAKENLSPPFKFLTCTAYPHLPFEDVKFKLIYAGSVLTHLAHLTDMWLVELRRILAPDGCALVTIHDDHTWRMLAEDQGVRRMWMDNGWLGEEELAKELEGDVLVIGTGKGWDEVITFFRRDWIEQEWGQYFARVSFANPEAYQSTVVLRKH